MKKSILIILLSGMIYSINSLHAQYTKQWNSSYSAHTNSREFVCDFLTDPAQEFIYSRVLSERTDSIGTYSITLLKHRVDNGEKIWELKNDSILLYNRMCLDKDQNIYTSGETAINSKKYFCITKYNKDGIYKWRENLNDSLSQYIIGGLPITSDNVGNIYISVLLSYQNPITKNKSLIIKYDSLGNKLWSQENPDTLNPIMSLKIDEQNNIYAIISDFSVAKYNSQGIIQWVTKVPVDSTGGPQYPEAVIMDKENNIYIMGTIGYFPNTYGYNAAKVNNDGTVAWVKNDFWYFHGFGDITYSIKLNQLQDHLIISGVVDPTTDEDFIYKLNTTTGQEVWKLNIPHTYNSHLVELDKEDNLLCFNIDTNNNGSKYILWLTKYNDKGIKINTQQLDSSTTQSFILDVILDKKDNILLASIDEDFQINRYIHSGTSIKDIKNEHTEWCDIYPNPFNTSVNFNIKENITEKIIISLFDVTGNKILQTTSTTPMTTINTNQLPSGTYFYTIDNSNGRLQSGKIIAK